MTLRLALLYEDEQVFVELKPEVLKEMLTSLLKEGLSVDEIYDRLVEEVTKLTYRA